MARRRSRSTRRKQSKRRSTRVRKMRGGGLKEDALQAIKDNKYSTPEDMVSDKLFKANSPKEVSLTGNDGISYTYKVEGSRYYNLYSKKEGTEYEKILFLSFYD